MGYFILQLFLGCLSCGKRLLLIRIVLLPDGVKLLYPVSLKYAAYLFFCVLYGDNHFMISGLMVIYG